jgi:kynurenine 3-monooxygenase
MAPRMLGVLLLVLVFGLATTYSLTLPSIKRAYGLPGRLFSSVSVLDSPDKATFTGKHSFAGNQKPVTVLGGGPCGLAAAIMLARKGHSVQVFERLDRPLEPSSKEWESGDRSYNIGISGRGQNVLSSLGVMDLLDQYSSDVLGRKDWAPGAGVEDSNETVYTTKSYVTKCIQRERLVSVLLSKIESSTYKDTIRVHHNTEVKDIRYNDKGEAELKVGFSGRWQSTPLVVGCDGGPSSALRKAIERESAPFKTHIFEDKNVRLYKTIPLHFPPKDKKWRGDLNYSARTGSDINIDALPTRNGPYIGVVLYRPWDTRISQLKDAVDARAFFDSVLPMFSEVLRDEDLEKFSRKDDCKLPRFMYAGPHLNHKKSVLLGDAAHTVKPYFGLGVNSAFEDVAALDVALDKHGDDLELALAEYSGARAKEAKAMVQMSQRLDGPGIQTLLFFVLPLIVDNVLHKSLPWLFSPNTLSSLQNEKRTFTDIRLRKRIDRIMQFSLLGGSFLVLKEFLRFSLRAALRLSFW